MSTPLQESLHLLYAVQLLDSALQHNKRLLTGLETGAAARAALEVARKEAEAKRKEANTQGGALKDSELKLSTLENKQKSFQQKLYQGTVTNAKELGNIEKEIAALGRQRDQLDEQILTLMDAVEAAQTEARLADAALGSAEETLQSIMNAAATKRGLLEHEIASLTEQRTNAAALVTDQALLKRYEQLRAKLNGIGLAKLDGGQCTACRMTLPTNITRALRDGQELQTCDNCGRLLTA